MPDKVKNNHLLKKAKKKKNADPVTTRPSQAML